jgi:uncharacterized membrane protein YiaA
MASWQEEDFAWEEQGVWLAVLSLEEQGVWLAVLSLEEQGAVVLSLEEQGAVEAGQVCYPHHP